MSNNEDFYTIEQAAERMGVNKRYINTKIVKGDLKAYKQGKRKYILHSDLIEFIKKGKQG